MAAAGDQVGLQPRAVELGRQHGLALARQAMACAKGTSKPGRRGGPSGCWSKRCMLIRRLPELDAKN